jgi:ribosomal protein S18 acetylase RimI-like enzyme
MTQIRPLQPEDFPDWFPLWDGNNLGQRNEQITASTWSRLTDPQSPVHGLCAVKGKQIIGLVHYILHPTTGALEPICYMQDLYVDPAHRGTGIAKQLVKALALEGKKQKWARIYWLADSKNEAVQGLYKHIGSKLDFTLHILPIG